MVLSAFAALAAISLDAATLLETESFAEKGGWVVDQQFMDQMGSPFLLAHGLGKPVADAVTKVTLAKGEYKVWVRTRDWVAPQGPGRFKVVVPGRFESKELGVGEGAWHWEDAPVTAFTPYIWEKGSRFLQLVEGLKTGANGGQYVNVKPRVIARYAKILAER